VNFKNQGIKSTQAVARLINQSGGPIDYLRLSKLVYLAERQSIISRGVPIVGGHYFSMKKGPTIGEIMDYVHNQKAPQWKETISPRHGNEVRLESAGLSFSALSQSEIEILDSTVAAHVGRTTDELVEWCHLNCPEYEEVKSGRRPIQAEKILIVAAKSQKCVQHFVANAKESEELEALLA